MWINLQCCMLHVSKVKVQITQCYIVQIMRFERCTVCLDARTFPTRPKALKSKVNCVLKLYNLRMKKTIDMRIKRDYNMHVFETAQYEK